MLNFDKAPGELKRFNSTASFEADDNRVIPRAFWSGRRDDDWVHFDYLEETISFFRELLEREKFDGVFGFSQGGTMATILTALCERPHAHPLWAAAPLPGRESYPWPPAPFKFCIVSSGFFAVGQYLSLKIFLHIPLPVFSPRCMPVFVFPPIYFFPLFPSNSVLRPLCFLAHPSSSPLSFLYRSTDSHSYRAFAA